MPPVNRKDEPQQQRPPVVENGYGDDEVQVTPVQQVLAEMAAVVEGSAVTQLRMLLVRLVPDDKAEAQRFAKKIERLRQTAEMAYGVVSELASTR